jgi:hypothetical protein
MRGDIVSLLAQGSLGSILRAAGQYGEYARANLAKSVKSLAEADDFRWPRPGSVGQVRREKTLDIRNASNVRCDSNDMFFIFAGLHRQSTHQVLSVGG